VRRPARRPRPSPAPSSDPAAVRRRLDDRLGAPPPAARRSSLRSGATRAALALGVALALGGVAVAQLGGDDVVAPAAAGRDDQPGQSADTPAPGEQPSEEPAAPEQPDDGAAPAGPAGDEPSDEPAAEPAAAGDGRAPTGEPVVLAFAGDIHAERSSGVALRAGLPSIRDVLGSADLTVVNLEMAITERGTPAPKQFVFRAPASVLPPLLDAGVDVASVANNHGLDFGQQGLTDTLAAADAAGLPVVGLGQDEDSAFAPHVATVKGQRIAVIGATQVLDSSLQEAWTALPGKPGMASAKRVERLVQEVERARQDADTVVVYLHWGKERDACPLPRQEELASQLVAAGADVVVGTHAHVLLGGGYLDGAYVDYGLGNFVFGARSDEGARTGVLKVTVQGRAVTDADWAPAVIRDGAPYPLAGEAAQAAIADKDRRRQCTNLAPRPAP